MAAAQAVSARVAAEPEPRVTAHTQLGEVEVGVGGADPARLAQLDTLAEQRWATSRSPVLLPSVGAGVLLVVGLVLLATRLSGLGVFLLVAAAAAAGLAVREVLRSRGRRRERAETAQTVQQRVDEARARAVTARQAQQETRAEVAGLARAISESDVPAEPGRR